MAEAGKACTLRRATSALTLLGVSGDGCVHILPIADGVPAIPHSSLLGNKKVKTARMCAAPPHTV